MRSTGTPNQGSLKFSRIALLTNNKAAVLSLRRPRQQSGQEYIRRIYNLIRRLRKEGNTVTVIWTPAHDENKLMKIAKDRAQKATGPKAGPPTQRPGMKSTMLNNAQAKRGTTRSLPEKVGKHSKRVAAVRWTSMEGSERTRATQDRHGQIEQLSSPHQLRSDRFMSMRTSEGDSRAFSLPMHQMDDIPHGDAPMYRDSQEQHIVLPRREDTDR
jgi:hypothetical protein